jgi:broad specificity phosphatase PhoE
MGKHRSAILHVEFWDNGTLIADFTSPIATLPRHSSLTCELACRAYVTKKGGEPKSTVSFQVLDAKEVGETRTVYLVRHGESAYSRDHPLSERGRNQAEGLGVRLAKAAKQNQAVTAPLLRPDVIYTSPLSRTVQTAAIAFGPLVMKLNGLNEIVLMANARELKSWGGSDHRSTYLSDSIVDVARQGLKELYPKDTDPAGVVDNFTKMQFDTNEVQDNWWSESNTESSVELAWRLQEFMSQLLYTPHKTAVVVGHSHFFQQVIRAFVNDDMRKNKPDFVQTICNGKLSSCGVIRLDLDPRKGLEGGPIVSAELVLGSRMVSDKLSGIACCATLGEGLDPREISTSEMEQRYPAAREMHTLLGDKTGPRRQTSKLPRQSSTLSQRSTSAGSEDPFHGINVAKFKRAPSTVSTISNPRRQGSNVSSCYSSVNGSKRGRNKIEFNDFP